MARRDLEPVVFLKPYPPYNAGETAGVHPSIAARLIEAGSAARPGERAEAVPQPRQGSAPPQALLCGVCGSTYPPDQEHKCASLPALDSGVFDAGFTGEPRRRGKHRRGR